MSRFDGGRRNLIVTFRLRELLEILKTSNKWVIVEGNRDKEILERFGLKKIYVIGSKSLERVALEIKRGEVVILTDFDDEGIRKFKKLKRLLESKGIVVDKSYRRKLKFLARVGKIEELKFYLNN
jgi:5S rRNA maturation endonuclease (ribonuclease M5)